MQDRAKDTKLSIVSEALRLFLTHGYDNVSLNQIAVAADVSKGGLTHHFSAKDQILEAAVSHLFSALRQRPAQRDPRQMSIKEVIAFILNQVLTVNSYLAEVTGIANERMNYHRLFLDFARVLDQKELMDRYFGASLMAMEAQIEAEKNRGTLDQSLDSSVVARTILSLTEGSYIVDYYLPAVDREAMVEQITEIIWRGIRS